MFLKVIGAIALVVLLALIIAFFWLRFWWRNKVAQGLRLSTSLGELDYGPVRLMLGPAEFDADEVSPDWARWCQLGFERLGDYRSADYLPVRLARRADGLCLCLLMRAPTQAIVFLVDSQNRFVGAGQHGLALETPKLKWMVAALAPPEQIELVERTLRESAQSARVLDVSLTVRVIEQAYGMFMDHQLATPPSAELIRARATTALTESDLRIALEQMQSNWRASVNEAALANWRAQSKIDAESWSRLEGKLEVVPEQISDTEVGEALGEDELSARLLQQYRAQGLGGIRLYAAVAEKLPLGQALKEYARVQHPVPARLFLRGSIDSPQTQPVKNYAYAPADGAGKGGLILANSALDAMTQLRAMGHQDMQIVSEPTALESDMMASFWQADGGALYARAVSDSLAKSIVRALVKAVLLWLPPTLLAAYSLYEGRPYTNSDWFNFLYLAVALVLMLWLVLPMALYHASLAARARGDSLSARNILAVLRLMRPLGISRAQLERERAAVEMAEGKYAQAIARIEALKPELDQQQWLEVLYTTLSNGEDNHAIIAPMRALLALKPDNDLVKVDLALALARYERDADAAETLLSQVALGGSSAMTMIGYHYVRGLILAERGQHQGALHQFGEAIQATKPFANSPLVGMVNDEIRGFAALSLRALGRIDSAQHQWLQVANRLSRVASTRYLLKRWEAAN